MQPVRIPSRVHLRFEPRCWDCLIACQEPNSGDAHSPEAQAGPGGRDASISRLVSLPATIARKVDIHQRLLGRMWSISSSRGVTAYADSMKSLPRPWLAGFCECYCRDAAACGARADGLFHMYDLWWPSSFGRTVARRMIRSKATMLAISKIGEVGVGSGKRERLLRNPFPVACRNQRLWLTGMPAQDL